MGLAATTILTLSLAAPTPGAAAGDGLPVGLDLGVPSLRLTRADVNLVPRQRPLQAIDFEEPPPAADEAEEAPGPRSSFGKRVLAETGAGLATSALGILVGGALGAATYAILGGPEPRGEDWTGLPPYHVPIALGALVGGAVGVPVGTTLGGHLTGADGNLLAAGLGALVGVVSTAYVTKSPGLGVVGLFLGSTIGYELSVTPLPDDE